MKQLVGRAISSRLPLGSGGGAGPETLPGLPGGGGGQARGSSLWFGTSLPSVWRRERERVLPRLSAVSG